MCGIGWDFDASKGSHYITCNGVVFASACSLDKNCVDCNETSQICNECSNGTIMNDYGICQTPDSSISLFIGLFIVLMILL